MANPQAENGYTRIANELYDSILKLKCTGLQKELIFAVIRFTYGFNRKESALSLRFLAQYLARPYNKISKTLNDLIEMNIIRIKQDYNKGHISRVLELNKDYDNWKAKTVTKMVTIKQLPKKELNSCQNSNSNSYQNSNKEIQLINTKIKTEEKNCFNDITIPEELREIKEFREAYKDWYNYRKEIKKPLTPTAVKKQLKQLSEFNKEGYNVIEIIDTAITSHWQGLYKPKTKPVSTPDKNTFNTCQPFTSESDRNLL